MNTTLKSIRLKNMLTIGLVILSMHSFGQTKEREKMIAPEKLQQDFKVLRAALEEGYPGMNRYHPKRYTDSLFDSSEKKLQKKMSEREFFLFISKIVMQLQDGHMDVYPTEKTQDLLKKSDCTIPFQAFISKGKMYVQKNYSTLNDKELLGAEIISINGQPVSSFIGDVLKICTSDGNNQTNKYKRLESTGLLTQYLYDIQGYRDAYKIKYIPFQGTKTKITTLKGIEYQSLLKIRKDKYPGIEQLPAKFNVLNASTAYLKIASFNKTDYRKNNMDFVELMKSSFETIKSKDIKNLILDLRGNLGGTDAYGKILYSYFTDHDFLYYSALIINKPEFDFTKYTDEPDLKIPEEAIKMNEAGTYDVIDHPNVGMQKNSLPYFSGQLYVLIDGDCFSTTAECLSMLYSYTSAVFIGEESGGGYYGNFSGSVPNLTLPNSKLQIGIPLMKYMMAVKDYKFNDRGVIPNYHITPTIKDRIESHDPELEYAKKLLDNDSLHINP
ncbi:S41 family peptidase [Chryseobacterium sp. M5A1_1a]